MNIFFLGRQLNLKATDCFLIVINKVFGLSFSSAFRLASLLGVSPYLKVAQIDDMIGLLSQAEQIVQNHWVLLTEKDLKRELGSYKG